MELLFLWIENDGMTIQNQSFNFSNHINFLFSTANGQSTLSLSENPNYIENLFGGIVNVTGIIGENGVGKTNLLNFIISLLTDNLPLGERFVASFKNHEKRCIETYHTLDNINLEITGSISGWTLNQPIEQKYEITDFGNYFRSPEKLVHETQLIFYSPVFDLRDYPSNVSNEHKDYVDVSTNGLVENDIIRQGDYHPEDIDKIQLHKFSNVQRQFYLSINSGIADFSSVNIPQFLSINFHRRSFNPDEGKRNLTSENIEILKEFNELIKSEFSHVNSLIYQYKSSFKENGLDYRGHAEYKKYHIELTKIEFTFCLLHNYFENLNALYNENIGISREDIVGETLLERASSFFSQQKWYSHKSRRTVKTQPLYEATINLIDDLDLELNSSIVDDFSTLITNTVGGVIILSNYENYIISLPIDSKINFVNVSWRNISSGENALLDLYSRLFFAKSSRLNLEEPHYLYVIIDEGEAGFHPQWQSEYLYNLLRFVSLCFPEFSVQIILTSHSPFVVSDLPKNNLIFLEKINDKCKVVSFDEQETFGANIHTLLSSRFFMKNGVVGKFANQTMLSELKDLLDEKVKGVGHQRLKKVISIIGEPVLQAKLFEVLATKKNTD